MSPSRTTSSLRTEEGGYARDVNVLATWRLGPLLLCALALLGCATTTSFVGRTAEGARIVRVGFSLSNAYLIETKRPILIDTGGPDDLPALEAALRHEKLKVEDLSLAIVTHGHFDHAGLAAALKKRGVPIMLGAGDVELARRGRNDDLRPTSFTADALKLVLPDRYARFEPDIVVDKPLDLSPYGVAGEVIPMPGHTRGSLVVVLANGSAFVGDQMAGGILGGVLCPEQPTEHYFQADVRQNHANIRALVRIGVETFYLGHGGPVRRDAVIDEFGGFHR